MRQATRAAITALRELDPTVWGVADGTGPDIAMIASAATEAAIDALFPGDAVRAVYPWRTNADLIYDAWQLGYVKGFVYDATPGAGGLWSNRLGVKTSDWAEGIEQILLNLNRTDFRKFAFDDGTWDTVFFDPPYKLNGSPDGLPELSKRYGVDVPTKVVDRHVLMVDGLMECIRITRSQGHILVKCQDQVANGRMHWQTHMLVSVTQYSGKARLVDRFDMLGHYIPQPMKPSRRYPKGREQRHAHARPSTLLVFERI